MYSLGVSEEITGRALREFARREEVVIATKVFLPDGRIGPNQRGLSRLHILQAIDDSLRRLGTDYVDLYQIHRYDPQTPIEETLEALHDVVKAGKARYIGASSMYAWQFARALYLSEKHGWTRFVSMQNHYNLVYREEEREMLPLCRAEGIGVIPWSPLARGFLTGSRQREGYGDTKRAQTDDFRPEHVLPGGGLRDRRAGGRAGGAAWRLPGSDRPGLAAAPAGGDQPDHRGEQDAAPGRGRRRFGNPALRRRAEIPGRALPATPVLGHS